MKSILELEGRFCYPNDSISTNVFYHDIYKKVNNSTYTKPIAECIVFNKKKKIYLANIGNFFHNSLEYGMHFEGSICIEWSDKQIEKLAEDNFNEVNIPELLKVNINGIELDFFPERWLY